MFRTPHKTFITEYIFGIKKSQIQVNRITVIVAQLKRTLNLQYS